MIRLRPLACALLTTLMPGCRPDHGSDETRGTDTTTSTSTAAPGDSSSGAPDTTTGAPPCADNDAHEPNDLPESPALAPWDETGPYNSYVTLDAFLCAGESDWYRVDVSQLEYRFYALHLDGIVEGSSWCGQGCDDPWLPDAPENSISIDVHDAETLALLGSQAATDGRVDIGGAGEAYGEDLLIHVRSPTPTASFAYMLSIEIRGYDGEDECEC